MDHRYDNTSSGMRMRQMPRGAVVACLAMAFVACTDSQLGDGQSQMVVEGWIEDGEFPVVILTRTLPVSGNFVSMDNLSDYIVKWAKVTVSDGQDSVVLTGKYDDRYFPPYVYTTGRMRGRAGSTYLLTVEEDDVVAMATTTIPKQEPQVAFKVEQRSSADSFYQITACLTDQPDSRDYYQIFSRVGRRTLQYSAAYLGSLSDVTLAAYSEIPVYRGKSLTDSLDYTPYFEPGDSVSVKFAAIDEQSFFFWSDFTKNISLSSNLFLAPSTNISSNVSGALGCWYGMNAVEQRFVIAKE